MRSPSRKTRYVRFRTPNLGESGRSITESPPRPFQRKRGHSMFFNCGFTSNEKRVRGEREYSRPRTRFANCRGRSASRILTVAYAAIPAAAQHFLNICAFPDGVKTRTTSGFFPQNRHVACCAFNSARAVTLVLDPPVAFFAIVQLAPILIRRKPNVNRLY